MTLLDVTIVNVALPSIERSLDAGPSQLQWILAGYTLAFGLALGAVMHSWTDAALPWLDAMLAALSLVAQWWQARRHTATWWLWIVVDVVYVGMYAVKSLHVTAGLYLLFIGLAVMGLRAWRKAIPAR